MRIGIECSTLTRSKAGIGYYTYQLVQALARQDGDEEYSLLYNRPLPPISLSSRLRHVLRGPASTHAWAQLRLSSICRQEKIDLLHSPGQGIPLWYKEKCILTVHDLSPILFPEQKEFKSRMIWNYLVPIMARKANHIITPSGHTRQDVIDILGISGEKVTRVYEAASEDFYPELDQDILKKFRKSRNLDKNFILAVGTLEPRKNYPFLLQVFAQWLEKTKNDALLVIIGKKGWLYDEIFRTCKELHLENKVRFEGYVDDEETMRYYYSSAKFFMMPPLYEGFWLPGLESLACGTPVIAPKNSSITEVIGEAGCLLESWDIDEWITAMERYWNRSSRDGLSKKGIDHAKKFSWDKAARETLKIYRQVLAE